MLPELIMVVRHNSPVEKTYGTVNLEEHSTEIPKVGLGIPGGLDENLGGPESDGLNVFSQMLRGPARHPPVAQGNTEIVEPSGVGTEVVSAECAGGDRRVLCFGSVLLRDDFIDEVLGFNSRLVEKFDKDVVWLYV
jgi:hypothetical protein